MTENAMSSKFNIIFKLLPAFFTLKFRRFGSRCFMTLLVLQQRHSGCEGYLSNCSFEKIPSLLLELYFDLWRVNQWFCIRHYWRVAAIGKGMSIASVL